MTALTISIFSTFLILAAGLYLVFWTIQHAEGEVLKTAAIIIYCFCFTIATISLVIEVIKTVM